MYSVVSRHATIYTKFLNCNVGCKRTMNIIGLCYIGSISLLQQIS